MRALLLLALLAAHAEEPLLPERTVQRVGPGDPDAAVRAAERLIGKRYAWGGRDDRGFEGVDCLGVLFLGWGEALDIPWRAFPVDPSKIVRSRMLGMPVPGLAGVLREQVDLGRLRRGDVLYFLLAGYRIPDAPLWEHEGASYWPWHTGLYADEGMGMVIHAEPGGAVRKQRLEEIPWDALYVTRWAGR